MLAMIEKNGPRDYPCFGVLPTALVSGFFALYDGRHVP
jgi:hypothetical protein